jgi:hypothetical protein
MSNDRFCVDCSHCSFRKKDDGIEVMCSNELAPISWRNKWILRKPTQKRLLCPNPTMWFHKKGEGYV